MRFFILKPAETHAGLIDLKIIIKMPNLKGVIGKENLYLKVILKQKRRNKMKKINRVPKVLMFVAMLLFMSAAVYAQDTSGVQSPSVTSPSTPSAYPSTTPSTSPSTTPSTTQSNQSPRSQDLSFNSQAAKLANELVNETGLSSDKAPDIVEILKDYRNDLADARAKYLEKHPNATLDQEETGSSSTTVNINMGGILGKDVDKYYVGASPDLMSDYKDADKSADKKIKKVFDNDVQTSRYEQSKQEWWSEVKGQVFASLKQNSQNQHDMQDHNEMQDHNDMHHQDDMHNQSDTTKY